MVAALHFAAILMVLRELGRQSVAVINDSARTEGGALLTSSRTLEPQELIIASLGIAAPKWPNAGGLAVAGHGIIAVDRHQRSVSHPNVFAVGDVAARQDRDVAHSGIHAVMAGPVLAQNLRSVLKGGDPRAVYTARKASIDKHWISQYASLIG